MTLQEKKPVTILVRKGWFWWQAIWLEEPTGWDDNRKFRSRTREGAISQARQEARYRQFTEKERREFAGWEEA